MFGNRIGNCKRIGSIIVIYKELMFSLYLLKGCDTHSISRKPEFPMDYPGQARVVGRKSG
jgi:hypothetical protein